MRADDPVNKRPESLTALLARYGSARRPDRDVERRRPPTADDAVVDALGQLSAALETAEDARGHLYAFHRLSGRADLDLQAALEALGRAGHPEVADPISELMVGRDVAADRWTFQLVEEYDSSYLEPFRQAERAAREHLGIPVHLAEAEMKHREQSDGHGDSDQSSGLT
jgi:hypothetical protein